jgi:TorA maturation chaperone TorD
MPKKDVLAQLLAELETKYQSAKKKEAEELHNAIADVITAHTPDAQTLLYVLEMIRFETLSQKFGELFIGKGTPPLDIKAEEK